ncbi:MAG: hypothetical protein GC160_20140 [Acidobacteria bacterium]|nr:hypothetical protein [Acidobacteriota bacterium]
MLNEKTRDQVSLYLYGELEDDERLAFEAELERSQELQAAVEREERFLRSLNARPAPPVPDSLLAECRHDLMRQVYRAERNPQPKSWWEGFLAGLGGMRMAWQPTMAMALVALGFWGGSTTGGDWRGLMGGGTEAVAPQQASILATPSPNATEIQSVELDPQGGEVEIVIEERRTIRGNPSDPFIRGLLISTVEGSHSGARLESLAALGHSGGDAEVRRAMIHALLDDDNPGVRLNALGALASHKEDPEVRAALIQALQKDDNPGVRVQAIDLLTDKPDQELAGVLQQIVRDESNNYVKMRGEQALHAMNASVELY